MIMSEVVAEEPHASGYKNLELSSLVGLINDWFESVVEAIPPSEYTTMAAGEARKLHMAPGLGEISLAYLGSRYLPRTDDQPMRPLQECTYTLTMAESDSASGEPLGWWMKAHLASGPKLVLDTPASLEDLLGSTVEQRARLETVLRGLKETFVSRHSDEHTA